MSSTPHRDLGTRLARRADDFDRLGGTELDLQQVLARAGEIKRGRRLRATMVMAACVLAIAVPTLIASVGRGGDKVQPAPPHQADSSPITLAGLDTGAKPRTGWIQDNVWHGPTGREIQWTGGRVTAVAPLADALLVATSDENGQRASLVPTEGNGPGTVESWPIDGSIAVSADGDLAAFVKPDGTPEVVESHGASTRTYRLPRIQRGSGFNAVAVEGGQGCSATAQPSCRVWVTSSGASPESWVSTRGGIARKPLPSVRSVTDVDRTGTTAAAIIDVREDLTTCSAAVDVTGGAQLWATCDHRLEEFSPDGARVLAAGSVGDGIGETQLAVLDARTGKVEVDLRTADQAFVARMEWEDDTHVLATVFEGGRWAVLRIGLDGRREYAVPPVAGEDLDSPFVLAAH
ncbi:MAG TPA: hypothetical protein VF416_09850 [Marmoricola sp.]